MTPDDWQWFGQPGHRRSNRPSGYSLHAHIGAFCVATFGEYVEPGTQDMIRIGPDRHDFYETAVCVLHNHGGDWRGGGPQIRDFEVRTLYAANADEADANHRAMCRYAQGRMIHHERRRPQP